MSPNEVVNNAVNALKSSPMLLVLILLNCAFIVAALLYLRTEQRQMDRMLEILASCERTTHGTRDLPDGGRPFALGPGA